MKRVAKIAVDIDHGLRILVADAGTIRLADGARADDNQKFGRGQRVGKRFDDVSGDCGGDFDAVADNSGRFHDRECRQRVVSRYDRALYDIGDDDIDVCGGRRGFCQHR